MAYDHLEIETRWQRYWDDHRTFRAARRSGRPKRYVLDMFPYPSGVGLHVGHPEGYTATDILARAWRMRGHDVLHPMGWDAFGLPAEQHAIETGQHPAATTASNIATFKRQLRMLGFSYDWSREIDTTEPGYVRWTQWIFLQLFRRGLAYQATAPVNWCPALGTVLANEEVVDGKSERGGHPVYRTPLRQWMLRITAYADRLAEDLALVDWPEGTLTAQRRWIGRSEGAEIVFGVDDHPDARIAVFTTRPDTLMGATYVVLAPEHQLTRTLATPARREAVAAYVQAAARKSELDRVALAKTKTGVPTGAVAIHPITGARLPIWVADYVLGGYGTGAVMAVPAHDQRDFEFATIFGLPIVEVVSPTGDRTTPSRRRTRTTASTSAAASSTAWRHPKPSARSSADSRRSAAAAARSATGCATGSSPVSATGASPSRSTFPSSSWTRPATLGEGPRTGFSSTSRSRSTSPSCRCACPTSSISPRARTRPARSHASATGASSGATVAGSPARPTPCRNGRARAGTTCGFSTPPTTTSPGRWTRTTPGCPSTSTSGAPSTRCSTSSTPASGTRCSSISVTSGTPSPS